jgi:deaminated glutathione amidase
LRQREKSPFNGAAALKIALFQMTSGVDRTENTTAMCDAIVQAKAGGAEMLFLPEMSGLLDRNRSRAAASMTKDAIQAQIQALCAAASAAHIWVHIGSIACEAEDGSGKYGNRSLVLDPQGTVRAHYDKMHLFDVSLPSGESWKESAAFAPGAGPVAVETPWGLLGLSICYDMRFSALYQVYANTGAAMIAVPAAFTQSTGEAHWHVLLRARAIETQAFVIAAAQTGTHADGRKTYGHSLVVDPWGIVLLDMGTESGLGFAELDMNRLAAVRSAIPVRANQRPIEHPQIM